MVKPKVVAELCCNHKGEMNIARHMINMAQESGAHVAKFQKRDVEQYDKIPHPDPSMSYGPTYYDHRLALEFSQLQHSILKDYCEDVGIIYSCSVWDMKSAQEIVELEPEMIKIPSAGNIHYEMLDYLVDNYLPFSDGQLHISLGMTTEQELSEIKKRVLGWPVVFYACTSGYPIFPYEAHLKEILKITTSGVGYSGHHLGTTLDIAAYTLGAEWIERHVTLDKTWKGTDHGASLEFSELRKLVDDLNDVHAALTYKPEEIVPIEKPQREKLKWVR